MILDVCDDGDYENPFCLFRGPSWCWTQRCVLAKTTAGDKVSDQWCVDRCCTPLCEPLQMRWRLFTPRVPFLRYTHTTPLRLRPYQETCLESCLDALKEGSTKIGVSLPTGAGKTVVFVSLLERLQTLLRSPGATRSLVIVSSVELARQAADQARKLFPHWTVEIEQGTRHTASGLADVFVLFAPPQS